ncbi:MAG: GTP 3',8-cyclase MoaA, partial [Planctomycetia bacterium]
MNDEPSGVRAVGLVDRFGRRHTNLRISVTDRCNIRCTYCMPEDVVFQPREHVLTFEEILRFVEIAASLGVDKIRLTGGEPLIRKGLPTLIRMVHAVPGIRDVGITTNGTLLAPLAAELFDAGLRRINISLDTLDREQFKALTRRDALDDVLAGVEAARAAGFRPIKINAVAIAGTSESQIVPLAEFCRDRDLELRFIEFMPLEADHVWKRSVVLTADR